MKRILLFLAMSVFGMTVSAAEAKFAYIDIQKAIQSTTTGQKAKKELETEFNKKKAELEKKEADLKKMNEDLKRKESVLSEEVLQRKQGELQQEMLQYRELVGKSQMEIQKKERDLTQPILDKLKIAIEKVAKEGAYSMIFEKAEQSVIWAKNDLDITDQVVKEYEKIK